MENNELFLVQGYNSDYERAWAKVMTAPEIFQKMDMADCDPDFSGIEIWRLHGMGEAPEECSFLEKGFDRNDRQKMCIVGGGRKIYGYGTEH